MLSRPAVCTPLAVGGEELLDSYDAERRPVTAWITEQTLRNLASVGRVAGQEQARLVRPEFFRELGMVLGPATSRVLSAGIRVNLRRQITR